MIRYEFEYFSFFVILKLFPAGKTMKKIEKNVFIDISSSGRSSASADVGDVRFLRPKGSMFHINIMDVGY